MSDSYIQQRLRWKGLTFRDYLRNTVYSAGQHKKALRISAENMPVLRNTSLSPEANKVYGIAPGAILPRNRDNEEPDEITMVLNACQTARAA